MVFLLFLFGFVILARIAEYLGYYLDNKLTGAELLFSVAVYIFLFGWVIVAMSNG